MRIVHRDMPVGIRFHDAVSSNAGTLLREKVSSIRLHIETPTAAYGNTRELHEAVDELAADAVENNWDGEGSQAVSPDSVACAHTLIDLIPAGFPEPDFDVGPRGEITLEWRFGRGLVALVSVYPERTIGYSVIKGAGRFYGREPFTGEFPAVVLAHLKSMLN